MTDYQAALENEAARLFADTHPVLALISQHIEQVSTRERDLTGVGFYTTLSYDPGLTPLPFTQQWVFTSVMSGECEEMPDGFSLLFHLDGGFLSTIEGLANEGDWKIESKAQLNVHPIDHEYRFLTAPYLTDTPK